MANNPDPNLVMGGKALISKEIFSCCRIPGSPALPGYLITPSLGAKQDNRYQSKQIGIYKSLLFQTLLNFYCRESIPSP
jgi:hypothetical protein